MSITVTSEGSFDKTESFLKALQRQNIFSQLSAFGQQGVAALSAATPIQTGETAGAWSFKIEQAGGKYTIVWTNSHVVDGVPIAIILQYGHGTGTGGYVPGRDYINPAMAAVFDNIADSSWKVVTST